MVTCKVCGKPLNSITSNHLKSKTHQDALKAKGINDADDPAKGQMKSATATKKRVTTKSTAPDSQWIQRLDYLETRVQALANDMRRVLQHLKLSTESTKGESRQITFAEKDVKSAISICLKAKGIGERWVTLDNLLGVLKVNSSKDRDALYRVIEDMFYNDHVDLAEGGNPKYPIRIRGNSFGRIALQNGK